MSEDNNKLEERMFRKKLFGYVLAAFVVISFYFLLRNSNDVLAALAHLKTVLQPILIGFVMAFLMNPMMVFFEKRFAILIKKFCKTEDTILKANKANRTVSSIIALVILSGIVIYILQTVIPNLINTVMFLARHIDEQIAAVLDWCNMVTKGNYEDVLMKAKDNKIGDIMNQGLVLLRQYVDFDQSDMVIKITTSVLSVGKFITNIIIGMFVSVYVLMSKELFKAQVKKMVCGIFAPKYANIVLEIGRKSGEIFYGFIIGKIIDSVIIGLICYAGCLMMKMPYPVLISTIIGVTNIIPIFGPYIGAVPTVLLIFLTEPVKGISFLIFILILQQIDGNLIGPKILGDSTGISSFWVLFAVVVGGGFFGVSGMIIAVPIVAIFYYILGSVSSYLVKRRNLPEDTADYTRMDYIDIENNSLILQPAEKVKKPKKLFFKLPKFKKK